MQNRKKLTNRTRVTNHILELPILFIIFIDLLYLLPSPKLFYIIISDFFKKHNYLEFIAHKSKICFTQLKHVFLQFLIINTNNTVCSKRKSPLKITAQKSKLLGNDKA